MGSEMCIRDKAIAQAVAYLAVAAKSNSVYSAVTNIAKRITETGSLEVPMHIRNAPTNMMKELDYGADYNYAHNRQDAFVPGESYLPESLYGERYYFPVDRGLEIKIAAKLDHLRRLNEESDFQRYESDVGDDNR